MTAALTREQLLAEELRNDAGAGSWTRVDLGPALRGEVERARPTVLRVEDGKALFYAGRVNGVHGDSGDGKTWAADVAAAQEITAGHHVLWVDLEDDETVIVERLRDVLGVPTAEIVERLHYHRPTVEFDDEAVEVILDEIASCDVTLVVVDSLGEAFGLEGLDEDRDVQVGPWLRRVARRLADAGPAVVLIDHSTKAKDNALFPSGSKRKRAAITGASYFLEAVVPLTREHGGRLRLTCAKDRHGAYRRGAHVATIDFHVYPDGGMSVKVWPPSVAEPEPSPDDRLRLAAQAAVNAARTAERPLSGRELEALMDVRAAASVKRAGIDHAVIAGAIRTEPGPRRSTLHVYASDLEDDTGAEV